MNTYTQVNGFYQMQGNFEHYFLKYFFTLQFVLKLLPELQKYGPLSYSSSSSISLFF